MTKRTTEVAPLSTRRVFVLHVGAAIDGNEGVLEGRVEHLASGRVLRFRGGEELLAFLAQPHEPAPGVAGAADRSRRG